MQYRVIDINGKIHTIMADGYSISDKNNLVFWTNNINFSGEDSAYLFARFNFDNIISITKYPVDTVEIKEMSDSIVEPDCRVDVQPSNVKHSCATCKHTNLPISVEPCKDCSYASKWEAKNESNKM